MIINIGYLYNPVFCEHLTILSPEDFQGKDPEKFEKAIPFKLNNIYGMMIEKKNIYLYQKNKKFKLMEKSKDVDDLYPAIIFTKGIEIKLVSKDKIENDD
jgi:hypothetical protein